jgi:hypothetical protein
VLPPGSQIGPISTEQRQALIKTSLVAGVYEQTADRESAYELLKGRAGTAPATTAGGQGGAGVPAAEGGSDLMDGLKGVLFGTTGPRGGRHAGLAETLATSAMRTMGSTVGREIIRGVLGSLLGGSSRRR